MLLLGRMKMQNTTVLPYTLWSKNYILFIIAINFEVIFTMFARHMPQDICEKSLKRIYI